MRRSQVACATPGRAGVAVSGPTRRRVPVGPAARPPTKSGDPVPVRPNSLAGLRLPLVRALPGEPHCGQYWYPGCHRVTPSAGQHADQQAACRAELGSRRSWWPFGQTGGGGLEELAAWWSHRDASRKSRTTERRETLVSVSNVRASSADLGRGSSASEPLWAWWAMSFIDEPAVIGRHESTVSRGRDNQPVFFSGRTCDGERVCTPCTPWCRFRLGGSR